ncbi:MAG TPA: ECF transporter S component [Candidatus Cloacimonadota bacterium]|nr:ECF transporter S component [Candidatus Cloacimonadota bacterium]HPS38719.1 ECF transporter S component [Candidatus Cloacimonadota bacterium]
MLKRLTTKDLIIIAILAAIGLSIKPLVSPISKMISTPLMLPGGSFAGGFYMMWLVLSLALTRKIGSATLFGVIQALVVLIQGSFGNHGALSLLTYTIPAIAVDLLGLVILNRSSLFFHLSTCALANMCGALIMAVVIFRHPLPMLIVTLCTSLASGIVGGYLSYLINFELLRTKLIDPIQTPNKAQR